MKFKREGAARRAKANFAEAQKALARFEVMDQYEYKAIDPGGGNSDFCGVG